MHKDGSVIWARLDASLISTGPGKPVHRIAIVTDITAQKNLDAALAQSAARFRAIFDRSGLGIARVSLDGRIIEANDRYCAVVRRSREDLLGLVVSDITHPGDIAEDAALQAKLISGELDHSTHPKRYLAPDGSIIWINVTASIVHSDNGDEDYVIKVVEDITERNDAVAALAISEERLRLAQLSADLGIFDRHADGTTVRLGGIFARFGYESSEGELVPDRIEAMIPLEDRKRGKAAVAKSVASGQAVHHEFRLLPPDQPPLFFRMSLKAFTDADGQIERVLGTVGDITALRNAEEQLRQSNAELEDRVAERTSALQLANLRLTSEIERREATQAALFQSQKLEALGQLTSGIAHDFNNVIMAIAGGYSVIARRTTDPRLIDLAQHGAKAAERGSKLVKQLLAFARQQELEPVPTDLCAMLDEAQPLLERSLGPGNALVIECPGALPAARIDPNLLETALINLAVNARDSLDGNGTLKIEVFVCGQEDDDWPDEMEGSTALCIRVSDTGCGMPPEILQRATEPFFTTKPSGKGTGMGLAMVAGFVRQSGGRFAISSVEGEGTSISLYLPVANELAANAGSLQGTAPGASFDKPKVLLVDDDENVRGIVAAQLEDHGYLVVEAEDGAAAIEYASSGDSFGLLLTDVVMPAMDGPSLAARLRSADPSLPVIFMTGHNDKENLEGELVLEKPFRIEHLDSLIAARIGNSWDIDRESEYNNLLASKFEADCLKTYFEQWCAIKQGRRLADFSRFSIEECPELHRLAIVAAEAGHVPVRFRFLYVGDSLNDELGAADDLVGEEFAGREGGILPGLRSSYRRCLKEVRPVYDRARLNFGTEGTAWFERLILPWTSNGRTVDRLTALVMMEDR